MGMDFSAIFKLLKGGKVLFNGVLVGINAKFVYGILSQWYLLIAIPAMLVTYNVLSALEKKGILKALYNEIYHGVSNLVHLSSKCPGEIVDIGKFFECFVQ
jgi:hypothetical protein